MQQYAIDLRQARFRRAVTGVDPEQLHALLDEAATVYEAAYAELEVLRQKQAQLKEELAKVHEAERAVSSVVVKADAIGRSTRARAERQGTEVVARAEERLAEQLAPLQAQCEALRQEILALQARRAKATGILESAIAELRSAPAAVTASAPLGPPTPTPSRESKSEAAAAPRPTDEAADSEPALPADEYQFDDLDERLGGSANPVSPVSTRVPAPDTADAPEGSDEVEIEIEVSPSSPARGSGPGEPETTAAPQQVVEAAEATADLDAPETPHPSEGDEPEETVPTGLVADSEPVAPASEDSDDSVEVDEPAPSRSRLSPTLWAVGAAAILFITAALGIPRLGALASAESAAPSSETDRRAAPVSAARQAPPQVSPAPSPATTTPSTPVEAAVPLRVRLTALRECWVRMTVDGVPTERILPAGAELVRDAEQEVILRVGDAGAIEVEVNGVVQAPLGSDGEVVNRLYTAE
jgi:prefoldin subunit 5